MKIFNQAVKNQRIREVTAYLQYEDENNQLCFIEADDLISIRVSGETTIAATALLNLEASFKGAHSLLDKQIRVYYKIMVGEVTQEVYLGQFYIEEQLRQEDKVETTIYGKDGMLQFCKEYKEPLPLSFPTTTKQFIKAICEYIGIELYSSTFTNQDFMIETDRFIGIGLTYRDILEDIAEISNTIIFIKDDKLYIKSYEPTNVCLSNYELMSYSFQPQMIYNSLVLSRHPQEDNVYCRDEISIAEHGCHEIKLVDNYVVNHKREEVVEDLFTLYNGLTLSPFHAKTIGLGYIEIGDVINFKVAGVKASSIVCGYDVTIDGGIIEEIYCPEPVKTETEYKYASTSEKRMTRTELIVDKQEGKIESVVEEIGQNSEQVSNLTLTIEQIKMLVSDIQTTLVGVKNYFNPLDNITPGIPEESQNGYIYENGVLKLGIVERGSFEFYNTKNLLKDFDEEKTYSTAIDISTNEKELTITLICGHKASDYTITQESQKIILEDFNFKEDKTYQIIVKANNLYINIENLSLIEGSVYQSEQLGLQEVSTKIYQTNESIEFIKDGLSLIEKDLEGYVNQTELKEYIRFDGANIELGTSMSSFKTVLTNEEIGFYDGNIKVAYVNNHTLLITDAIIKNSLRMGNFIWKPRKNGNLSLVYGKEEE